MQEFSREKVESVKAKKLNELLPFLKYAKDVEFTNEQKNQFNEARGKIAEQLGYVVLDNDDSKWFTLAKDGYIIELKHFMLPNNRGFRNGRISEAHIKRGNIEEIWDNGSWGVSGKNIDPEVKKIFKELTDYLS